MNHEVEKQQEGRTHNNDNKHYETNNNNIRSINANQNNKTGERKANKLP